jgi:hypothetical protein
MRYKTLALLFLLALLAAACGRVVEIEPLYPTEVTPTPLPIVSTVTPEPTPLPAPTATPVEAGALIVPGGASAAPPETEKKPLHGLLYALVLPVLIVGVPWVFAEIYVTRYVRPRGLDVTRDLPIKAQDGLLINTTVSMTAQKTLSLASLTTSWPQAQGFVEKPVEQELRHEAAARLSLDQLERDLKGITEGFMNMKSSEDADTTIITELIRDFGIKVLRFNVEVRYPQETMDALNRKAEASAGGMAYLAYADAAELDPGTSECRELYTVYQQTSGQVDAARNLGGGISNLVGAIGQRGQEPSQGEEDNVPS